ncbi:MAG: AI-2E family transporter [Butyrivibrio sp.]|nr:AI-2E family transporter [Butyrivibrio sp.]
MDDKGAEGKASKRFRFENKYVAIGVMLFLVVACSILYYFAFFKNKTLFGLLKSIMSNLSPFIIGSVLAYLLKPICAVFENWTGKWFSKMKNRRFAGILSQTISIAVTAILFLLFIYVLLAAVIPQVIDSGKLLIKNVPTWYTNTIEWLKSITKDTALQQTIDDFAKDGLANIQAWITKFMEVDSSALINNVMSGVTVGLKSVLTVLKNLLIGGISCLYILAQRKKLAAQGKLIVYSIFKEKWADKIMDEMKFIDKMFSGFINGKLVDSIIIGILTFIVTSIFKIPYALLISVVVGVTNIIPFFGPFIGGIPSAFIVLMVSPLKCLYFIIIIIAIQQFDGNILGPKILGNTTGVSSFWVLFSITFFGGMFGFTGMLIGVPLFAVLYDIIKRLMHHGLAKRNKEEMYEEYEAAQAMEERAKAEAKERRRFHIKNVKFHKKK